MKLHDLVAEAKSKNPKKIAVAAAEDHEVIEAVVSALKLNLATFLLYGDETKITQYLASHGVTSDERVQILHSPKPQMAANEAVKAVSFGEADVLMKGLVPTATLLKAVLNKEFGLRTGNVLSHIAVFEVEGYDRFTIVTDAAMNIAPDLNQKVQITKNAVDIATSIGITNPKVAPIAAVEVINPDMQATIDAAALSQMNKRGQLKNCIVDGPLALDNAVSLEAAEHKGISSEVAGRADILLVPTIEVGNVLYKSLIYFANAKVGAVIAGAKAPIVLTSRSDSAESKLNSLILAVCSAN
jgi:phosphate butyryltransferase